jgi:formylglycine-generating enzyme required for sulfatase activity
VLAIPKMITVPEGYFWMGSDNGQENETPRHRVWVDRFGLGQFAVTNKLYKIFVAETGVAAPPFCSELMFSDPDQPVVGVTWHEATAYCKWLSAATGTEFRLPSEAERERAARGNREGALYPWGDEPPWDRPYMGYDRLRGGPGRMSQTISAFMI